MLRFSVIIPCYNIEKFLPECIESLISQDYTDVEIILVDDGATDKVPEICDRYALIDSRIKVVHKENGGLVSARQAGCSVATGEYILNVDGDDFVLPNYFDSLENIIVKYHPDYICFGATHFRDGFSEKHIFGERPGLYSKEEIEQELYPKLIEAEDGNYLSPSIWSKAIKRDIYTKAQMSLNPAIKIGEDQACSKPALTYANSVFVTDESLYMYRLNPLSMTKNRKPFPWNGPELIGKHLFNELQNSSYSFDTQIYRNLVHNLFNVVCSRFYEEKSIVDIIKDINNNLNNDFYQEAISKVYYEEKKGKLIKFALQHRLYFLFYMYSKRR
ncbi:MAG: glycosyltransferase family 2 protein [Agathobacter sp.]|uniref:glycosyltransferase family 2 protein n=1 Tax=unclassified Bariatricus TaxID=2677046 RepID=UPI002A7CD625|nr:glycosyltransferase family 2 protein [Agathobacter sp.]